MRRITEFLKSGVERFLSSLGLGMRAKLIIIFLIIKVIPLVLLTFIAWRQFSILGDELGRRTQELTEKANQALTETGDIAVRDAVEALDEQAVEDIERMSTDVARSVADFLYERDDDILFAASLKPDPEIYRNFVERRRGKLVRQGKWALAANGRSWVPARPSEQGLIVQSSNRENNINFNYRPPDTFDYESRPLYLEMTFVDLDGNEVVKVVSSGRVSPECRNVSDRRNTFVRAETYFEKLKNLEPGEIYVSDVIGAYVRSHYIGMYTPENLKKAGLDFEPEEEAYAGMENPLGKRFEGLVRWATPVVSGDEVVGYVTLALDHDHIMEFTDHIAPTEGRYTEIPSAFEGNYAFIWDYMCRSIVHPRHHSIVGFDPETGDPEVPWLEDSIYRDWQESGRSYVDFIKDVPTFHEQSTRKKPARELTKAGLVGLDGRYLNNAPQCTGWFDLTSEGGSGSFVILWSGLTKLTTAATIPYYTGHYGESKRGFGFVAIGAGFEDFQRPARETEAVLGELLIDANHELTEAVGETKSAIERNLMDTTTQLTLSAGVMIVLVVLIAIWMASIFTRSITNLINGISRFRSGERHFRFRAGTKDELGTLADSFDEMADSVVSSVTGPLVITDLDRRIKYMNEDGLRFIGKNMEDVTGAPYAENSVYPAGTGCDPIAALHEGREADVLYLPESDRYVKGSASYLTDRQGRRSGYIIVTGDVTEIARAVAAANRANEYKGEFLARMSHEIRTPMNAIIGMTNIVKRKIGELAPARSGEGPEDAQGIQADLGQIEASSQHLLGLLNDILDISKIEAGKIELSEEAVDIYGLADTVASIIRPRCEEKNISFEIHFDRLSPQIFFTDSLRLRQVLINLLGNAVKFTPECGRVEFRIEQADRQAGRTLLRFSVIDNGIGISEERQGLLFRPFEQAGSQVSRRYGGTGLGLAISRSIVRMLGGDIGLASREGEGSAFTFALWLREAEDAAHEEAVAFEPQDRFAGRRALLVDDVQINRIIAADMLDATGMTVDEAEDGAEAVRMFENSLPGTYDIVYMDIQMPVMDGYEATSAIRGLNRTDARTVKIVALTANAFKDDIDKSLEHGMNAHLAKPLEAGKLLEVTYRLLVLS